MLSLFLRSKLEIQSAANRSMDNHVISYYHNTWMKDSSQYLYETRQLMKNEEVLGKEKYGS